MNYDFDFNINNYTIGDLHKFFSLEENHSFNDINENCVRMNNIISESKDYDKVYKTRLGKFLDQAKFKLVEHIKEISQGDDGFIEDYDKLLIANTEKNTVNKTSTTYAGHTFVMHPETITFNDVINKEKRLEPLETYPTNISRSNLNNLKRKTILQTIVLNTLFREDYFNTTSTDFTIVLPYFLKMYYHCDYLLSNCQMLFIVYLNPMVIILYILRRILLELMELLPFQMEIILP